MAGFTYSTLTTAILNYTEVGTGVLSSTITDQFIDNSELRIQRDIPVDADRREVIGNLVASKDNVNAPAGTTPTTGQQTCKGQECTDKECFFYLAGHNFLVGDLGNRTVT